MVYILIMVGSDDKTGTIAVNVRLSPEIDSSFQAARGTVTYQVQVFLGRFNTYCSATYSISVNTIMPPNTPPANSQGLDREKFGFIMVIASPRGNDTINDHLRLSFICEL